MNGGMITHRLIRVARRDKATEVMHRGGVCELVELTTWERSCSCGRVFVGTSELLSVGYFLAHLPKPKLSEGDSDGH